MKMQRKSAAIGLAVVLTLTTAAPATQPVLAVSASAPAIVLEGTIVTMNAEREVIFKTVGIRLHAPRARDDVRSNSRPRRP